MYKQELLMLLSKNGIICILDKGNLDPICTEIEATEDITSAPKQKIFSPYDPYVFISNATYYNCSKTECVPLILYSITQVTDPSLNLKGCDRNLFQCEAIRYNYLNNDDKLKFLMASIDNKLFYSADCLVYGNGRVCHGKDASYSHVQLLDTGSIARPNETGILAADDLLCEQNLNGEVTCDINTYVPVANGLTKVKDIVDYNDVLLKTGTYLIPLNVTCEDGCFLKGRIPVTRRQFRYRPQANKQQICKKIYNIHDSAENVEIAHNK